MKYRVQILTILFILTAIPFMQSRTIMMLDSGWVFSKNSENSEWRKVSIPHTWNAEDGTSPDYYRGKGNYRCVFDAPKKTAKNDRTFLRFEGVSQDATVWLNGKRLGLHRGAFTAFCFELTHLLKNKGNILEVEVTNAPDSLIMPLEGDFTIFGGIYRPVTLDVLPQVCFTPLDYASCGIYISQSEISDDNALLDIVAKITGASSTSSDYSLRTTVFSPEGTMIGVYDSRHAHHDAKHLQLTQQINISQPHLWNGVDDPAQYRFFFELLHSGIVVDTLSQNVGLRYFRVDPHKGFFLNGKRHPLHGVNRHQDRDGMGWAISHREHYQDMKIIQEIGANCIRLAHYPHANEFYSLCDEAGMLVWAEIPYIGKGTQHLDFDVNARQQLIELIRQNYNHCSIFCWSLFNELGGPDKPHILVSQLNDLAHSEDPTRLTVAAANNDGRPENEMTDIMAYNTYPGWYWAEPEAMKWAIDWKYDPAIDRAIGISEYGAGASIHQHELHVDKAPKTDGEWHPEEWQAIVHEANYREIAKRDYVWGSFVWNMFDFASASRHEGDRQGINDKGLVTYDRATRKDAFYFYQANWSKVPMIYITSRRHTLRTQAVTDIKVYSNCDNVGITLNGVPVLVENCGMHVFVAHNVVLQPGENTVEATGTIASRKVLVTDHCIWNLK